MPHEHAEQIEQVFTEVMEQMAFIFVDPAEAEELPDDVAGLLRVSMAFGGAAEGSLTLLTGAGVCTELAANITGDDEAAATDPEVGRQALMELLNVICGQLLTTVAGSAPVFDLTPPLITEADAADWADACADERALRFMADDQPFVLRFEYPAAA